MPDGLNTQAIVQGVINFVRAQFLLELRHRRVVANQEIFHAGNFREVFQMLRSQRLAEAGVMRAAAVNPAGTGRLKIGPALPDRLGNRQLGHRLVGLDDVHFVDEQTEPVADVNQRRVQRRAGGRVENQPRRVGLAADAQRMDLQRRFAVGDGRTDFQHVRAENLLALRIEMIGVILHERGAAGQADWP